MAGKYIAFAPEVVEQVVALSVCAVEMYPSVFNLAVQTLEGGLDMTRLTSVAEMGKCEPTLISKIVQAASILLWDVTKGAQPKDELVGVQVVLRKAGWTETITTAFVNCFKENRIRLNNLKGALAISKRRYKDFVWRLDVELGRRNVTVLTQPKFMVRLDVYNARAGASGEGEEESLHLQADYANLKHMQMELQRAMDELNSKHGQRITRYIK